MEKEKNDFSNCSHIELKEKAQYQLGDIIASIEKNNFGDQIIYIREYKKLNYIEKFDSYCYGFKVVDIITNYENNHFEVNEIKKLIKSY